MKARFRYLWRLASGAFGPALQAPLEAPFRGHLVQVGSAVLAPLEASPTLRRHDAAWRSRRPPCATAMPPGEAPFWRRLSDRSGTATPFWRRSPVRNVVQALEEDCSNRLRIPDPRLASLFSHRAGTVLAPLLTPLQGSSACGCTGQCVCIVMQCTLLQ